MDNIIIATTDTIAVGFINSRHELEYTEYEANDGGFIDIDNSKEYTKEELTNILASFIGFEKDNMQVLS